MALQCYRTVFSCCRIIFPRYRTTFSCSRMSSAASGSGFSRYSEGFSYAVSCLLSFQLSRPATAFSAVGSGVIVYRRGDDLFVVADFWRRRRIKKT